MRGAAGAAITLAASTLAAIAVAATPVMAAAPATLTNSAEFEAAYAGAELDGCILSFEAYQPPEGGGPLLQLTGSLAVYRQPLGVMMKLAIGRMSPERQLSFAPPAMAGLRGDAGQTNAGSLLRSGPSPDTPGAALFAYDFDLSTVNLLRASLNAERIQGYFAETAGGPATPFSIDLGVMKQPLPGAPVGAESGVTAMKACVQNLASPTP